MKSLVKFVLIALILAVAAGSIWLYVRRNTGLKLLSRAETALNASQFEEADKLAYQYTVKSPQDWKGWCLYAQIKLRRGKYEEARKILEKALELAPDEIIPRIALADSYAWAGRYTLARRSDVVSDDMLLRATEDIRTSIKLDSEIKTSDVGQSLDIKQSIGINSRYLGDCYRKLEQRYRQQGRIDQAGSNTVRADELLEKARNASIDATKAYNYAAKMFLDIITSEPTRETAAVNLAELCIQNDNLEIFDQARQAILSDKADLPEAKVLLMMDELQQSRLILSPPQLETKIDNLAAEVDGMLKKSPDNRRLLTARLQLSFLQKGNPQADEISQKLLSLYPQDEQSRLLRAMTLMKQGNNEDAEDILFDLKSDYPNWPEAHFAYAQAVYALGKTGLARQTLRYITQIDPAHAGALRMLTRMMTQEGFSQSAYTDAKAYYTNHPNDPQAVAIYVQICLNTNRRATAQEVLDKAEKQYSDRPAMMLVVADCYKKMGDIEKARQAVKPPVKGQAKSWRDSLLVAKARQLTGDIVEAERIINEAYEDSPKSPEVNFARGELYAATGRGMQAIDAFRLAADGAPNNMRYRQALADAYFRAGLLKESLREAEAVLDVEPQNIPAGLLADQLRIILDLPARQAVATGIAEVRTESLIKLAIAQLRHGNNEKCIDMCVELLRNEPRNVTAMLIMGEAYLNLDRTNEALHQFRDAIKTDCDVLPTYLRVSMLLRKKLSIAEIGDFFDKFDGGKDYYESIAVGWLCEREGEFAGAMKKYDHALGYKDVPEDVVDAVNLRKAGVYDRLGDTKKAVELIDTLTKKKPWAIRALIAKAGIEISANLPVDKTLDALLEYVRAEKNPSLYDALVLLAMQAGKTTYAEKVCEYYRRDLPDSSRPYLMSGFVYNYLGKPEAVEMYSEAIRVQPMNLSGHIMLARVYDRLDKPQLAIKTLDEMSNLGPTAQIQSLYEKSRMLAGWGLPHPATAALGSLSDMGFGSDPRIQFSLGSALAMLGESQKAVDSLVKVPSFAAEYVPSQMIIATLEKNQAVKTDMLDNLLKDNPQLIPVRLQLAEFYADAGDTASAGKQIDIVLKQLADTAVIEPLIASKTVGLLMRMKSYSFAADVCRRVAKQSGALGWNYRAMLFSELENPKKAIEDFPLAEKANLFETVIGMVTAVKAGYDTAPWEKRMEFWLQYRAVPEVAWFLTRYELLAAVLCGKVSFDPAKPGAIPPTFMPTEVVESLIKSPDRRQRAAELAEAQLASEMSLPSLAMQELIDTLKQYPNCQWAAMLLLGMNVNDETLRKADALIKPADSFAAELVRAELLLREGSAEKAYRIYSRAVAKYPDNQVLKLRKAVAAEQSGLLEEALKLYEAIWKQTSDPIAANNAAAVISRLYPDEPDKLLYASKMMTQVLKLSPGTPAFMDTKGWVEFLRGNNDVAKNILAGAIKGLQGSPEAHYHTGMAERLSGDLGVWHLQAAVQNAKAIEARSKLSLSAKQARELAEKQLKAMNRPL